MKWKGTYLEHKACKRLSSRNVVILFSLSFFYINALVLSLSLPYHARVPAQIHNNKIGQRSKSISRLLITVCIKGWGFLRNSMFSPVGEGSFILRAESAYEYKKSKRDWKKKRMRDWLRFVECVLGKRRERSERNWRSERDEACVSIETLLSNHHRSGFKDKQIARGKETHEEG